jgi:hypothetical protein
MDRACRRSIVGCNCHLPQYDHREADDRDSNEVCSIMRVLSRIVTVYSVRPAIGALFDASAKNLVSC